MMMFSKACLLIISFAAMSNVNSQTTAGSIYDLFEVESGSGELETTTSMSDEESTTQTEPLCNETCIGTGQICNGELCICDEYYEFIEGSCQLVCVNCSENAICSFPDEIPTCECLAGFTGDGYNCTEIDFCADENICGNNAICKNEIDTESYSCSCVEGYYNSSDGCEKEPEGCICGENAYCDGESQCICDDGYENHNVESGCSDINECLTQCQQDTEICFNNKGSFSCECYFGYRRNDLEECVPVECLPSSVACDNALALSGICSIPSEINFPSTPVGFSSTATTVCEEGNAKGQSVGSRRCSDDGIWESPTWLSSCDTSISSLTDSNVEENREQVSQDLSILTDDSDDLDSETIEDATEVIAAITKAESLEDSVADNVVTSISNIMESQEAENSSDDLLAQLDEVAKKVLQTPLISRDGSFKTYESMNKNVALLVVDWSILPSEDPGFGVAVFRRPEKEKGFRSDQFEYISSPQPAGSISKDGNNYVRASIYAPPEATKNSKRRWVVVYGNTNFFQTTVEQSTSDICSDRIIFSNSTTVADEMILSLSVEEATIENLTESVVLSLPVEYNENVSRTCAFWDIEKSTWSSEGCEIDYHESFASLVCKCDHLTNFGALLDPRVITVHALNVITIVGCSISSISLIAVIVIHLFYVPFSWRGKRYHGTFLLVALSFTLLGFNITLLVSEMPFISDPENAEDSTSSCIAVAAILHFFMLSSCAWMNCEAVVFMIAVIKPFSAMNHVKSYQVVISSVLWAVFMPLLFVANVAAVDVDYYNFPFDEYCDADRTCWIEPDSIVYFATIPTAIMIGLNFICYVVLSYFLLCKEKESEWGKYWKNTRRSQKRRLATNLTIATTLGISWVFGFLMAAIDDQTASLAFAYIFTISTSFQGLFLLVFTILRNKDIRSYVSNKWKSMFTDYRAESYKDHTSSDDFNLDSNEMKSIRGNPYVSHVDYTTGVRPSTYRQPPTNPEMIMGGLVIQNWRTRRHSY